MLEQADQRSRRMWRAMEPVHAVMYFAPEGQAACAALGTKGYWNVGQCAAVHGGGEGGRGSPRSGRARS